MMQEPYKPLTLRESFLQALDNCEPLIAAGLFLCALQAGTELAQNFVIFR